jgi:hypothetical protein
MTFKVAQCLETVYRKSTEEFSSEKPILPLRTEFPEKRKYTG